MPFSDANRASIRMIEETTWGVTPATGKTREIRLTSSSLAATKETVVSDELRSDRMVSSVSEVSAMSAGDINFEFSAGAQDDFLAGLVMGAWSRPMHRDFWKGPHVTVTGISTIAVTGRDITTFLTVGHRLLAKGFVAGANNGYVTIAALAFTAGDTIITVTETSLATEGGTSATALYDANDVFVLNNITIASTATGFTGTSTPFAAAISAGQLKVGQKIVVDGLTGVTGVYTVVTATGGVITTSPIPTAAVAAGAKVSIKGSMLRNPSLTADIIQKKFSIETAYNDVSQFMVQDGMVPGTFSLEVASGALVTGTIGFQGRQTTSRQTTLLGTAPFTVMPTTPGEVVNATTNIGAISKNGVSLGGAIQSLSLSAESNLRQQNAIASKYSRGIGAGRFNLTGSMTVYFEDAVMFNHFLNHDTVALSLAITDLAGQSYVVTLPALKFSADQISPGGIDQDVFDNIEFMAFRDASTQCMLQIDRFSPNR